MSTVYPNLIWKQTVWKIYFKRAKYFEDREQKFKRGRKKAPSFLANSRKLAQQNTKTEIKILLNP